MIGEEGGGIHGDSNRRPPRPESLDKFPEKHISLHNESSYNTANILKAT